VTGLERDVSEEDSDLGRDGAPRLGLVGLISARLLAVVAFLALWRLLVGLGAVDRRTVSTPGSTAHWLWNWFSTGESWPQIGTTLWEALLGYLLGVGAGVLVSAVFFRIPFLERVFNPYMAVVNALPKVIVAPLLILVLGLGLSSKVVLAASLVFTVSFFNFMTGFRAVDHTIIDNSRMLGAGPVALARTVYVPALTSRAVATLRVCAALSLVGAIVGEFVGSNEGIGWNIRYGAELGNPERLMGCLVTLAVIAAVVDLILMRVERMLTRWRDE
jgi:NitT/TauT family transport system permease protein